ncbi:hypothetical protein DFH07DRAFT_1061466 [Mycena maculata]|uniref:BHLH domain-containing protein n=1 Tax=Mycena maculata TaxID=230809 RepID=A0AAD7NBH3_9AGAR|nr:hypothetical protein DFH07DRAFT_1061466 [Mycena maculata]
MDSQQQAHDQQTKDFMQSFFPQDLTMDQLQSPADQFQFHPNPPPSNTSSYNPTLLIEQQYKLTQLQQLQQLQNQIFQQQIALISGSQTTPVPIEPESRERVVSSVPSFNGLPTPGSSTELRAQTSVEYVSPMILNYDQYNQQQQQYPTPPRGSTSAPAHIAFRNTQPDLDFDISPLTSPWLGAHQQPVRPQQPSAPARPSTKRAASSSEDEGGERPSRKKQSPAIRATVPIPKKSSSRSKSANSTPLLRSTRSRKGSISVPGDTPSPVDLSMPPPAPPADGNNNLVHSSPGLGPQLTPVTPASIMNLGRLGITSSLGGGKPPKKSPATASPRLKAILPGATASGSRQHPPVQVRKTSHKAAEQKRRDSLKTTFDDLRGLLPPIPLPSDVNDEPVLPGALPPRGPPKAGGEGPNKGVSKLQLLMCGNDYIRQLLGRVERRDEEIGRLRREVVHLRGVARGEYVQGQQMEEEIDLERDLDAVEAYGHALGRGGSIIDEEGDEEGDD